MNSGYRVLKKVLAKYTPWLACSLALLGILACHIFSPIPDLAPTPTPVPVVSVDELRFTDPETGTRFHSLNDFITDQYVDKTWYTTSYHLTGNFYESSWCRGAGTLPDCQTLYSTIDNRDQHILDLWTLFYQDYPEVTGLGFHTTWVPVAAGWGADFSFSEGGGSTVGEGWQVTFGQYVASTGQPAAELALGSGYSYKIYETNLQYSSSLPVRDDLALYLAGPKAMRDRWLAQIQVLAQRVTTQISAHQVSACDLNPYQGGGINPGCTSRPMTPAEETAELARAEAYFTAQEKLLSDHYQEMYTAWMTAFPLDQHWP